MSGFQTPITIKEAMQNINSRKYLIPAFQRDYVWDATRVENLFDSLMRGFPINSMLFWEVKSSAYDSFVFYDFLSEYVEGHKSHNVSTAITKDFYAVLDGQQRLTSLYLGLYGTFAYHIRYRGWDNTPKNFPERRLYLNLTTINTSAPEGEKVYGFSFLRTDETSNADILVIDDEKWFRVGKIIDISNGDPTFRSFARDNVLSENEEEVLDRLQDIICKTASINYYLETEVKPDKAVNIFVRTNAGGMYLSISDIIRSLIIAGWTKVKAREEFEQLSNKVGQLGFSLNHDYIIKAFLCLFAKSVKNQISTFDTAFLNETEANWPKVRDSIENLFTMMRLFGLDGTTLKSYNATLPILCYMYWNNLGDGFVTSVNYRGQRNAIRKWLLKTLLYRSFGSSADSVLQNSLRNLKKQTSFPAEEVSKDIGQPSVVDPQNIEDWLNTQKDDPYAFVILSILYPNCNFEVNKFDRDHLHPMDSFDEYKDNGTKTWAQYNSIVNLQLLESNENKKKGPESLFNWVGQTLPSRPNLYSETYLPQNVDLSLASFDEFYDARKVILAKALKAELE